jgi:hypothetical protein
MKKPPKLGTVLPFCQMQVINVVTGKWETLETVIDAPGTIRDSFRKHRKKHLNIWVKHCYGRKPLF